MSVMIQIRNVPDAVHRRLKARAALAGISMSEYILREMRKVLERPTREEMLARIAAYSEEKLSPDPATLIREERDKR
jgi:plasmid stability protein